METNRVKQKKRKIILYTILLLATFLFFSYHIIKPLKNVSSATTTTQTLWKYQCIDTMKTSRDRERNWREQNNLHQSIPKQVALIKSLGANCIAIDTPYDDEFLPYLTQWVYEARKNNLHIWFRGNFSSWEGWFGYPKTMTSQTLLSKTSTFIKKNAALFADGDIFTPAPEAENGGEFNQVEPDEYVAFRAFLIAEYTTTKKAFAAIGKQVDVNWLSMNGGLAKRMLDQPTVSQIGNKVTIDHYIANPSDMTTYINYFAKTFNAKVIVGEFGSPIPEINGAMTEDQQANFVDSLFAKLYLSRDKVDAVNYWVLYDSSTALLNPNGTNRKVAAVVQKYFKPLQITGIIKDPFGNLIRSVSVVDDTFHIKFTTNDKGEFSFLLPNEKNKLTFTKNTYGSLTTTIKPNQENTFTLTMIPKSESMWDRIKNIFRF